MKEALTTYLLGQSALTDLVGTRVHWTRLPEGETARPFVLLREVVATEPYHLEGPTGLTRTRLQVDVYADLVLGATEVARIIDGLLGGYVGTVGGVAFDHIMKISMRDGAAEEMDGAGILSRVIVEFYCVWKET